MTLPEGSIGTVAQYAVGTLRRALISGELAPGDRIGQEQIAASLGISLAPVREPLATLEQEGQVTYRPRRGYFVTELDLDDVREIYELRTLLEDRAARRALVQLDGDAIGRIELAAQDCVEAASAEDIASELEANRRFHCGNYNTPEAHGQSLQAHDRIIATLRRGDPDALVAELAAHRMPMRSATSKGHWSEAEVEQTPLCIYSA